MLGRIEVQKRRRLFLFCQRIVVVLIDYLFCISLNESGVLSFQELVLIKLDYTLNLGIEIFWYLSVIGSLPIPVIPALELVSNEYQCKSNPSKQHTRMKSYLLFFQASLMA